MGLQQESYQGLKNDVEFFVADSTQVTSKNGAWHKQGSNYLHDKQQFNVDLAAATPTKFVHIVREGRWQLDSFPVYFQTGSTSGTVTVTVDTGTNAPGAGTAQLTAAVTLAAAAQQTQLNGTLIASPTVAGPGDRFSILIAGTMTSLANGIAAINIKRVG